MRKDIQSDLSGSTANFIYIDETKIYCANVGDSRAILIHKDKIKHLSNDHTPYIKSEYDRII
jgi:protein phosphatase PTC2/3